MRTTVRINDELLKRAKKRAAHEGRTLTSLVEEGLAVILAETKGSRSEQVQLPVSNASGGVLPGVDLNRSSDLEEVMNRS
jgi:Bacterial antitoxin of type II TA system, VapB